jgi:hypothetical protein
MIVNYDCKTFIVQATGRMLVKASLMFAYEAKYASVFIPASLMIAS